MGKKSKFKKIRRLASQMPVIPISVAKGERITGKELIDRGVTEVDGVKVNPEGFYKEKSKAQQPHNHARKMKQLYYKHGVKGVNQYAIAVKDYVDHKNLMAEQKAAQKQNIKTGT